MRPLVPPSLLCLVPLLLPACHTSQLTAAGFPIAGQVVAEDGSAIAGASVTLADRNVETNADGRFATTVSVAAGQAVAVAFSAPGYARKYLRVTALQVTPPPLLAVLRAVDTETTFAMPASGEPDVVITAVHGDAKSEVTVGAGSLVDAAGAAVSGQVTVRITAWSPTDSLISAPAPLAATPVGGGAPVALRTMGMADIEAEQAGQPLQVAPGASLGWTSTLPPATRTLLANDPNARAQAALYAVDANTGLFVQEHAMGPNLSYDATAGVYAAALPHLSVWNFDTFCPDYSGNVCMNTENGGCLRGVVMDCNGRPLANTPVTMWAAGATNLATRGGPTLYSLKDVHAVSDGSGHYCQVLGTDTGRTDSATEQVLVHLSGAGGPDDSSFVDPLDPPCKLCNLEPQTCNLCQNGTVSGRPAASALWYTLNQGSFCTGDASQCTALPDLYLGASCRGQGVCTQILDVGAACAEQQAPNGCCRSGLRCSDGVCVPQVY